jgi:muconolactone delta-isomerase
LAAQGHLLRLWRPPLQPGEWRTLGLFAADDEVALEEVLGSMPLRVWRTDEITPLVPHLDDPGRSSAPSTAPAPGNSEFFTVSTSSVPADTAPELVGTIDKDERDRARELAQKRSLERMWSLPGQGRVLGLWQAPDIGEMNSVVASLPARSRMTIQITPLSPHPSDPVLARG